MKKVFYFFSVAILAMAMVSCNNKNNGNVVTYDYTMELSAIFDEAANAPAVNVKLSEEGVPFILAPFKSNSLADAKESEIFSAIMSVYGESIDDFVHTKSGQYSFPAMSWEPGATYTIVGFIISKATLTQLSKMASAEIEIPTLSINKIQLQYDNDSSIFVSASNNDPYYLAFTTEAVYLSQIESGLTTVSQFVAEALKDGIDESKKVNSDRTYSEIADLYLLSGSQKYNFVEEYGDFEKGVYYALACGIKFTDNKTSYSVQPSTAGVAIRFELDKDYILPQEVRAQIRGLKQPLKVVRTLDFKVDQKKVMKSVRID